MESMEEAVYEPLLGAPAEPVLGHAGLPPQLHLRRVGDEVKPPRGGEPRSAESVDYLPADSQVYRQWLSTQRAWQGDRWLLLALIGTAVGLVVYAAHQAIRGVSALKLFFIRLLVRPKSPVALAWLVDSVYSMGLIGLSAEVVLRWAPEAAGSGVPEVMAHLNGVVLPRTFTWRTAAVKFLSTCLCVGSGLPAGQGGPMIFLGAAIGGLLSQGTGFVRRSPLLRRLWPFERFRDTKNKRDLMTAGCAAGVAAAFRAPLGGLLYVFEDVASFWTTRLGWQVFIAAVIAVVTHSLAESCVTLMRAAAAHKRDYAGASFFEDGIFFENSRPVQSSTFSCILAILVGLACGAAASAFAAVSLGWAAHVRARLVGSSRRRRLLEPCLYMLSFATVALVLPQAFSCRNLAEESGDYHDDGSTGGGALQSYTCPPIPLPNVTLAGANASSVAQYNELASLMNVRSTDAVRQLLSRGSHTDFGFPALFTFLAIYFAFSAIVAGSAVSSGLLIPMLLMGAIIGRIFGLAAVHVAYANGHSAEELTTSDEWRWIDPGLFAAVGAGAFLGGGTRQPLSSAVILVETTGEVRFLLPILLSISAAKWVSDFFMPGGIYMRQLDARRIPYLPAEPPRRLPLRERAVSCIMCPGPVVCVEELGTLRDAASVLRRCSGHSFPVVRDGAVVGLISREHLGRVVAAALAADGADPPRLTYPILEGRAAPNGQRPPSWPPPTPRRGAPPTPQPFSPGGWDSEEEEEDATALQELEEEDWAPLVPEDNPACARPLDLLPYVNLSATTVAGQSSALRAYTLFRTLGLRHLPVLDERGRAVGMVTRKELLKEHLTARLIHTPAPMTDVWASSAQFSML